MSKVTPPVAGRDIKFSAQGFVRCRVCGCTEIEPCEPPCSWVETALCSGCSEAVGAMYDWFYGAHRPNLAALIREYKRQVYDTPIPYIPAPRPRSRLVLGAGTSAKKARVVA